MEMTARLEIEIAIIKLEDKKAALAMMNILHLNYEDRVRTIAEYRLSCADIDKEINKLRDCALCLEVY